MRKNLIKTKKRKIILIIAGILVLCPLILFYGPYDGFRVLWINTAMHTSNHKFLATMLYSEDYINRVINQNKVETDEITDTELIDVDGNDNVVFAEINGPHYNGCIIKISDPSRISFVLSDDEHGKLIEEFVGENEALGGINAGGYMFDDKRGIVWGYCVHERNIINACDDDCSKHLIGGMDKENKLVVGAFTHEEIEALDYEWAVEFGPILVVNGEKTEITGSAGGLAPRTVIGQNSKGEILLLVIDGRQASSIGATYLDLQTVMYVNGAVNAFVLDGGASTSMVYDGELVNTPSNGEADRLLPNAIIFR